jgi:signal transduction histidine kinase
MVTRYETARHLRRKVLSKLASAGEVEEIKSTLLMCELLMRNVLSAGAGDGWAGRVGLALADLRHSLQELFAINMPSESRSVCLKDLVHDVTRQIQAKHSDFACEIQKDSDGSSIYVDEPLIRVAVAELLKNARTHVQPGTPVRLNILKGDDPPTMALDVKTPGYGIDLSRKTSIFEGPGLGLPIVKLAAEIHGGRVEELGMFKKFALFRLTLPIRDAPP